jgi:Txe/YoeB family toxin of Txe-Axe toxin-antitoxin module
VNKNCLGSSNFPGESFYVDISLIKERSFDGAKFWALIVDDYPYYCWSFILKNKSDLKVKINTLLNDLKIANWNVRFNRCDDSGENIKIKMILKLNHLVLSLNFRALEILKDMEKLRGSFKHFMGESGQC